MSYGSEGVKVTRLQEMLAYLGFMEPGTATGHFGDVTFEAVRSYQASRKLKASGVANRETQRLLEEDYDKKYAKDPDAAQCPDAPPYGPDALRQFSQRYHRRDLCKQER